MRLRGDVRVEPDEHLERRATVAAEAGAGGERDERVQLLGALHRDPAERGAVGRGPDRGAQVARVLADPLEREPVVGQARGPRRRPTRRARRRSRRGRASRGTPSRARSRGNPVKRATAVSRIASRPRVTVPLAMSTISASGAKTAATASASWAFHAAYVASLAAWIRARMSMS